MINLVLDYIDNQILYNDLRYTLTSNPYNIIYASKEGFVVEDEKTKVVYISFKSKDEAYKVLKDKSFNEYIAYEEYINEILNDEVYAVFNIYYYPSKEKIDLEKAYDFRVLSSEKEIDYLANHYDIYDSKTLEKIVKSESIFGLYKDSNLIGFIGIHYEGSMGFLYIDESVRHKGYGYILEALLINKLIDENKPVWAEVNIKNKVSQNLQAKLGMIKASDKNVCWIRKNEKK